ncbi:MAG: SDR family oxidoreductase [Chloroflexi bacterium]|nr:SDR family oxidoreductase [Chloroflexota bacterium]
MRVKDKVIIITGGGSGAGKAYAIGLAKEGAKVVVCGRRLPRLQETIDELKSAGGEGLAVQTDVSERPEVERMVQATLEEYGRIDCLINSAVLLGGSGLDEDRWIYNFEVGIDGKFRCAQAVARVMVKQGTGGSIINIGSIASFVGFGGGAYTNIEGTIMGMTRCMALELAPHKIRVNLLAMGAAHTDTMEELSGGRQNLANAWADLPLGRAATTDDTLPLAVYFCSDESEYVTGQAIIADGGGSHTFWPGGANFVLSAFQATPRA